MVRKIYPNYAPGDFPKWSFQNMRLGVSFIPFFTFGFWSLLATKFWNTKISRNLCLHFARQDGKKRKENHATKVTKIPKTKRRKYGMNETLTLVFFKCFQGDNGSEIENWIDWSFSSPTFELGLHIPIACFLEKILAFKCTSSTKEDQMLRLISFLK